jgi:hypothetical protein
LSRCKNYYCQLHGVNDIRQIEKHTAEPLSLDPSSFEFEIAVEKEPGIDQIPAELIQAGGNTLRSEMHKLIYSIWNKGELPY